MQKNASNVQILKRLISFCVPLILRGLLQQLFNWVDALIVGNLLGETALAGVGAAGALSDLFIAVLLGFTSGLSVLFARQHGEGRHEQNAHLLARFSLLLTAVFALAAALGIALLSPILELLRTPADLLPCARDYLRILLLGVPLLALYNCYSAALRGMGNSAVPFFAVLIASLSNAVLDVLFVSGLHFGVSGAAAATVLSQLAMTIYVVSYTMLRHPELRVSPRQLRSCHGVLRDGCSFGIPPALQNSVSSAGDLLLQRFMNDLGAHTVAAVTTAYRVDSVLCLPMHNLSSAIATLVAQECGAGRPENARRVFRLGTLLLAVLAPLLTALILFSGGAMLRLFGLGAEAVEIGERFFRALSGFYFVFGLSLSLRGYLEGMGELWFVGAAGICALGVRILCSYLLVGAWGNMVVAYAEAISWVFLLAAFAFRYFLKRRRD